MHPPCAAQPRSGLGVCLGLCMRGCAQSAVAHCVADSASPGTSRPKPVLYSTCWIYWHPRRVGYSRISHTI
ncbi:hypothetical protein DFH06DRAFT_1192043 [Mycena polygramma]|nr:hypothetical protein DFH06DRAFT_1192043 [Mycena polygramma]